MKAFTDRADDSAEGLFDVGITMPDGFQISKCVKVVAEDNVDGKDGFIFMLPDEIWTDQVQTARGHSSRADENLTNSCTKHTARMRAPWRMRAGFQNSALVSIFTWGKCR